MTKINCFLFFFSSACKIFCLKAKIQLRSGHGVQKRDNCSSAALSGFAKPQSPNDKRICDSKNCFSAEFTGLWTQTSSLKAAMRRKLNFAFCEIGTVRRIPLIQDQILCFVQRFEAKSTRRKRFFVFVMRFKANSACKTDSPACVAFWIEIWSFLFYFDRAIHSWTRKEKKSTRTHS